MLKLKNESMHIDICRVYNYTVSELVRVLNECHYFYFTADDKGAEFEPQCFKTKVHGTQMQYLSLLEFIKAFPSVQVKVSEARFHVFTLPHDVLIATSISEGKSISISILPEYALRHTPLFDQTIWTAAINESHLFYLRKINEILSANGLHVSSGIGSSDMEMLYGENFLGLSKIKYKNNVPDYKRIHKWIDGNSFEECLLKEDERKDQIKEINRKCYLEKKSENIFIDSFESKQASSLQIVGEGVTGLIARVQSFFSNPK